LEIARAGSIRRAASALRISQPSLVAQLQRIEQAVGGPVFTRTRSGVLPTDLGSHLADEGGSVIHLFDQLITETTSLAVELAQSTAVGMGAMRALDAATLIAAISDLLPGIDTSTRELDSFTTGLDLLRTSALDVALRYQFTPVTAAPDSLGTRVVVVEPAFVGLADDHPLAGLPEIPLAALAGESWIISDAEDGTGRLAAFYQACAAAGFTPRIKHHVGDCDTIVPLLRATMSVAIMHPLCLPPDEVVVTPLADAPYRRSVTLTWRHDSPVAAVIGALHQRLVEAYHVEISLRPRYRRWWEAVNGPLLASAPPGATAPRCAAAFARKDVAGRRQGPGR
jgi:DNA-binding transcriptional LysR family regulator